MLEITLFISGAVLMSLELTASRIMSPYVGSSIFVWTAIIGVILASLSWGYWQGGKLADKRLNNLTFGALVLFSSIMILAIYLIKDLVLIFLVKMIKDTRVSSLLASIIIFAPASVIFGMITPYATRLRIEKLKNSGSVIGRLYAVSTLGSIIGTFATGFFLIGFFGSSRIILILSFIQFVCALAFMVVSKKKVSLFLIFYLVAFLVSVVFAYRPKYIFDNDSKYQRIIVYEKNNSDNRPVRYLMTSLLQQSAIYLDIAPNDQLVHEYLRFFDLYKLFLPYAEDMLMIGGGGYSYPSYLIKINSKVNFDVVEIDREITNTAREYFGLEDTDKINVFHSDGRSFLNSNSKKYDVVFLDAYKDDKNIPFELTSLEADKLIRKRLTKDGVLVVNIISALEGSQSDYLAVYLKTLRKVFPEVFIFQPKIQIDPLKVQNVVIIALKTVTCGDLTSQDQILSTKLLNRWSNDIVTDLPVLGDDFSPVEKYTLTY